jgi:glycine/serine hydroxymethyltransferase
MKTLGDWIADTLEKRSDANTAKRVKADVAQMVAKFPIYSH